MSIFVISCVEVFHSNDNANFRYSGRPMPYSKPYVMFNHSNHRTVILWLNPQTSHNFTNLTPRWHQCRMAVVRRCTCHLHSLIVASMQASPVPGTLISPHPHPSQIIPVCPDVLKYSPFRSTLHMAGPEVKGVIRADTGFWKWEGGGGGGGGFE